MHKNEEMQKTYYGKALEIINLFRYKNFQIYIIWINWLKIIVEKKIKVLKEKKIVETEQKNLSLEKVLVMQSLKPEL